VTAKAKKPSEQKQVAGIFSLYLVFGGFLPKKPRVPFKSREAVPGTEILEQPLFFKDSPFSIEAKPHVRPIYI
jgi:hypothetical protein